jgi:uncharacterized protein YjiS (DUF1127 family)
MARSLSPDRRLQALDRLADRRLGRGLWQTLLIWHERARQRRALLRLDDHLRRDIGHSRDEALCEAAKPFWRA